MRQRLTIILTIVVILVLLVIINTVTYVKDEPENDSELLANRSTYHAGPTGSRALYDFLSEAGYQVMRGREAPQKLLGNSASKVRTFVVIGPTKLPFTAEEARILLGWIKRGGTFVLITRHPDDQLLPNSGDWAITARTFDLPGLDVNPANTKQMTERVTALHPVQPTLLTADIQAVMPSRFAARLNIATTKKPDSTTHQGEHGVADQVSVWDETSAAPVVHISDRDGALLVDYAYGKGRIILFSDPFVVANGGISLADNLRLATNMITSVEGLVAFDEYHQGRGITENAIASYFAGTPVLAIIAQIVVLILLLVWSGARRFGRPLPLVQVDRRSSLEFVASMSELQERSRAFDLAIENIYSRTRRALARYGGVDYNSSRAEVAARVALRSTLDADILETLMRQCEETINGAPINWRQAIDLVKRLREVERTLGLRMRSREIRQAAENI
jgi:Domain of unknown function (DUF4350)